VDSVQFGDVLTEIKLKGGYLVNYSIFKSGTIDSLTLVRFYLNNERLEFCFSARTGQKSYEMWQSYADNFGSPVRTREWFVGQLMEHPPIFEWFLFHPEIFEKKY